MFSIVAQEGSFSAAAERLYITQSAVSQHIKELEASLGQTLFDRGWHGARLTASGEVLAGYTRQVFELIAQAETALTEVGQLASGKVSIGATPGVAVYLAPRWVHEFRQQYPKLAVALNSGVTAQIAADVLAHRVDLGIIEGELDTRTPARLGQLVLDEVEQRVIVGFKHPFWDRDSVTLPELHQQSFVARQQNSQSRVWLEQTLKGHGIEPVIGAEFDNLEAIKRALGAGICLTLLPNYVVETEVEQHLLRCVPVEGQPFVRSMKLIWDRDVRLTPLARAFLGVLSTSYPAAKSALTAVGSGAG